MGSDSLGIFACALGNWKLCNNISEINVYRNHFEHNPLALKNENLDLQINSLSSSSSFLFLYFKQLKFSPVFLLRPEASFAEHWLWKLPGQWSLPPHCLRHWWQTKREDGGWVPPYEEPVLWASGQLHGFHHVSAVRYQKA